MWNIKVLALTVQRLLARLKFKLQGQGDNVKNNGTHGKVLLQGIRVWNIKALALTVQKLLAKLKFSKKWVKVQGQGHSLKNYGTLGKVSLQETSKC